MDGARASDQAATVAAAEAVAGAWNAAALGYVVLNGLAEYPARIGRDLDVVVERGQGGQALAIASRVLQARGWSVTEPPDTWGRRIVAFQGTCGMEIHTVERLSWGVAVLYSGPRFESSVGPFRTDSHGAFVKRVVLPLLTRRIGKVQAVCASFGGADAIAGHLRRLLAGSASPAVIERLAASLASADPDAIESARRRLAPTLLRRALLRGLPDVASCAADWVGRRVKRFVWPSGLTVALVGPDGAGKSSVASALQSLEDSVFTDVHVRHWRPGLLPELGRLARRRPAAAHVGPVAVAPRRRAGRFYWPRLLYYSLDFWLGHHLKDRWLLGRQVLLLYDRAFLDMLVDPVRYGLSSTRGMMAIWRLLPKPDLLVVLRDEPERMHARKPELAVTEIRRQLEVWQRLVDAEAHEPRAVVEVQGTPDAVARRLQRLIVEAFVARYQRTAREAPARAEGIA